MRTIIGIVAVGMLAASANAVQIADYGWEDGVHTICGSYLDIDAYNVTAPDPVHTGQHSLKLVDQTVSGTPQAYVACIIGLQDGDQITASFWRYDTTPGASPSARIWAHYTDGTSCCEAYSGSAGGNSDYGPGTGWDQTSHTWTFDGTDPDHVGFVVEARTYSNPGDTVWIDDLHLEVPDHAIICCIPEPATLVLLGLGGLMLRRRKTA